MTRLRYLSPVALISIVNVILVLPITAELLRETNQKNENRTSTTPAMTMTTTDQRELVTVETRIYGGNQVQPGEYPYFTQWRGGCGASLIHEDILLSAGHCNENGATQVIVGGYENKVLGTRSVSRNIVKRNLHPKYNDDTLEYDFVILKLNSPVTTLKPVNLNRNHGIPVDGEVLSVVGFGLTENGIIPQFLQETTVQAVNNAICNRQYINEGGALNAAVMLCATGDGKDSCDGDSGGPLVKIVNGIHTLVGVVSFGEDCASRLYSGVYSRVSGESDWIDQQICLLAANPPSRCNVATKPVTPRPTRRPTVKPTLRPTRRPTRRPLAG